MRKVMFKGETVSAACLASLAFGVSSRVLDLLGG
jgi:hypothetical protein